MRAIAKKLKRALVLLSCMAVAAAFAGCDTTYNPPVNEGGAQQTPDSPSTPDDPAGSDVPASHEGDFTVRLTYNKQPFTKAEYSAICSLKVYWTDVNDGGEIFEANFDEQGFAYKKLDGDYKVTLASTPAGYVYNPDGYYASNFDNDRHQTIELFTVVSVPDDKGTAYNNIYNLTNTGYGAYEVTLRSPTDERWFVFESRESGNIGVYSLVDTLADVLDPHLRKYHATRINLSPDPAYRVYSRYDTGGSSGRFTKNFLMSVNIPPGELGGGGEHIFTVSATAASGAVNAYPAKLVFVYEKLGPYKSDAVQARVIRPTESFTFDVPEPSFMDSLTFFGDRPGGRYILDDREVIKGPDGYYHLKDSTAPDGVGKLLYVKFYHVDPTKSEATIGIGGRKETGIPALNNVNQSGFEYNTFYVPEGAMGVQIDFVNGKNYTLFKEAYGARNADGSYKHLNADGCYPVNDELKQLLQDVATANLYFQDGLGWVENGNPATGFHGYQSNETSQWLFACCYY